MKVIYAIPGLGTTKELFKNISVANYSVKVLDWPLPTKGLTLKSYAALFLPSIDTSRPFSLLGVSFGGMICVELATILKPEKTILISSCKNSKEIPTQITVLKHLPVLKMISDTALRAMAKKSRALLGFKKDFEKEFFKMVDSMAKNYFIYCIEYIINWNNTSQIPLVHIHGTKDTVLPHKYIRNFIPVEKGSHAMVLYEFEKINAILDKELNEL